MKAELLLLSFMFMCSYSELSCSKESGKECAEENESTDEKTKYSKGKELHKS